MKAVSGIEHWADAHHPKWLDIIRILLGIVLIAKGITFIMDTTHISAMLVDSSGQLRSMAFVHYMIGVQLAAGLMFTFGLYTRVAALFQIPIILIALFNMDVTKEFFVVGSEFLFLVLVFALLVFFFIYGSGPISVDNYVRKHPSQ